MEGVPFVKHQCGPVCLSDPKYKYNEQDMRGTNPLLIPVKLGWKREMVMFNNRGRRRVYYIGPCGRRLRNCEELHRYIYQLIAVPYKPDLATMIFKWPSLFVSHARCIPKGEPVRWG